jgi:hypothetical protein
VILNTNNQNNITLTTKNDQILTHNFDNINTKNEDAQNIFVNVKHNQVKILNQNASESESANFEEKRRNAPKIEIKQSFSEVTETEHVRSGKDVKGEEEVKEETERLRGMGLAVILDLEEDGDMGMPLNNNRIRENVKKSEVKAVETKHVRKDSVKKEVKMFKKDGMSFYYVIFLVLGMKKSNTIKFEPTIPKDIDLKTEYALPSNPLSLQRVSLFLK